MKKLYCLLIVMFIFCIGCDRIPPGYEGIVVDNWGSQRGVQDFTVSTGWVTYNPITKSVFEYPVFIQTAVWSKDKHEGSPMNEEITFNSSEGMIMTGDLSLSWMIKPTKSPHFYVKFRSDDINKFTHGFLRNVARDAFQEIGPRYTAEEIYASKKEELIAKVREYINKEINEYAILEQLGFIGAIRLPQQVVDALNSKLTATQKAIQRENELREAKAAAEKDIAKAQGEAQANLLLSKSLTAELIKWRQLELTRQAIEKWDGRRPMVEGSNSNILMSLPQQ
jgi:regulator of protease activity HflC (stomatin/prohibitin superfamily)